MVPGYGMGMTVTDKRWTPTDVAIPPTVGEFAASKDIPTMDANLVAINATYWTATRLAQESVWDKLFYLRSIYVANNGGLA